MIGNRIAVLRSDRLFVFQLGGRKFAFRVKPAFPKSLTKEFLLVDLVNNVDQLAEAKDEVLKRVMERAAASDASPLSRGAGSRSRIAFTTVA
jgi:hypothetical protein